MRSKVKLDLPTVTLVAGILSLLQAAAFTVLARINPKMPGIRWWMASSISFALGLPMFWVWAGGDNPLLASILPTLLNASGTACFYRGAVAFGGARQAARWPFRVAAGLFAIYFWLVWFHPHLPIRPLLTSPLFLLFLLLGVRELWRERREGLMFSARFTALASLLFCGVLCYRGLALPFLGNDLAIPLFADVTPQILTFLGVMIWTPLWTFGAILLINQRQVLEIRRTAEETTKEQELRALAERELARLERERMAERLLHERRKILRDLHDGLGGITANLTLLAGMGRNAGADEKAELLVRIEQLAAEGNQEVRMLLDVFESQTVRWEDVIQGLRNYGDKLAAAHALEWKWQQRGEPPEMPVGEGLAAISMMRAIKEALNNAGRHAQATKVTVSLRFFPKAIAIVVSDDGIGLGAGTRSGRGMENMRRRVVDLGGRLRVFRGKGSRLSFMIPFETPDEIRSELASGEELATLRAK